MMRKVVAWVTAAALLAGILAFEFSTIPHSPLGWLLLFVLGIPLWLLCEWTGERTLGMKFFANLSSPVRILVGVPFALMLFAVGALLGSVVHWAANQ